MSQLESLFYNVIDRLEKSILDYPFEDLEKYSQWMNQQFFLVQNSTRYLALSASQVPVEERAEFREWVHHLGEELDHDVLILNDLRKMRKPHCDPMDPMIRALILAQYQDIQENGPNALLGYALMLEGLSCRVCEVLANRVEEAFGQGTASYLKFHAKVDEDHFPEGMKKIAKLSKEQAYIVEQNLLTMSQLYLAEMDHLKNTSPHLQQERSHKFDVIRNPEMTN